MKAKTKLAIGVYILTFVAVIAPGSSAHAAWKYYRSFTATSSATAIPAAQTNFPALISEPSGTIGLETTSTNTNGRVQNANGFDIAPFSNTGCTSQMSFERENYVSSTGELELWVKVPTLSTSSKIYLCYGNTSQTTDLSSSSAPWDSNFTMVEHFAENAASTTVRNSVSSTLNGSAGSNTNLYATSTLIDGGFYNNGATANRNITQNANNFGYALPITISAWVIPQNGSNYQNILANGASTGIWISSARIDYYFSGDHESKTSLSSAKWNYISFVDDANGNVTFYLNGLEDGTTTLSLPTPIYNTSICDNSGSGSECLKGYLDELRYSHTNRSSSWIATDYWNAFTPSTFWTIGVEMAAATRSPQAKIRGGGPSPVAGPGGSAWYSSSWSKRMLVTISHTQVSSSGAESYANFPVLVSVTSTNLKTTGNGGGVGNGGGNDILFAKSDGRTKLNHEIESYTSSTGNLVAWVNIGAGGISTSTDTNFYIYYGNANAANQQNVAGTWNSNYAGVWHFANGTTLNSNDSTANANNGTTTNLSATTGLIDGGMLSTSTSLFQTINNFSLGSTSTLTTEAWVNIRKVAFGGITDKQPNNGDWAMYTPGSGGAVNLRGGSAATVSSHAVLAVSAWTFVVGTINVTSGTIYMNGALDASGTVAAMTGSSGKLYLANVDGSAGNGLPASLDEVRVSNIVRSADWIKTEYNNEKSPSTFITFGSQQTSVPVASVMIRGGGGGKIKFR